MAIIRDIGLTSRHLAAVVFLVLIFLPLVFLGRTELLGSDLAENRYPQPFPKSWSVKYLERVSQFFNDNHGFRNALVLLGGRVMLGLGIKSSHPSVIVGEDGWLFYQDDGSERGRATMKDFRGRQRVAPDQLALIRGNLESIDRAFRRCGVRFVVWLIPNKQTIYGEHLTGFAEARGRRRLDQLVAALGEMRGLHWDDARPALLAAKGRFDGRDLYFRTDTHWNGLGAFIAYESLISGLAPALNLPRLENADPARYEIRMSPYPDGDLSANMLNARWRFKDSRVELVPRFTRSAAEVPPDKAAASAGVSIPKLKSVWTNPAAARTMVMYGDSFAPAAIPYLREHFGRGYFILDNVVDGEAIGKLQPDVVILQVAERLLASLAVKPRNLDRLCGS